MESNIKPIQEILTKEELDTLQMLLDKVAERNTNKAEVLYSLPSGNIHFIS